MATTALIAALTVAEARFRLEYGDELAVQRGGSVRVKQLRPDLWTASYICPALSLNDLRSIMGLIADLGGSRDTFYGWDPAGQYPAADALGTVLGSSTVQINSLNADGVRMSLKGLPASYNRLARGDYLSFDYGSPAKRALHQIRTTTVTANGSGVTSEFYVAPAIRSGASVNAVVTLKQPTAELMIVPGSIDDGKGRNFGRLSFDAMQVIG